jgi:hypothetical protein
LVKLQLLFFEGCPHWRVTDARLRAALDEVGSTAEVEPVLVTTPEETEAWRSHGSPSFLVDGEDPFVEPGAPVGLSCRLYRTPAGVDGSPTVDQLVGVLAEVGDATAPEVGDATAPQVP